MKLQGAWELVHYEYGGGGKKPSGSKEIKLMTDRHFAWILYDAKGKTLAEGGGTYTFQGNTLIEHLLFADKEDKFLLNNPDQVLTITFEKDGFTSAGTLTNGQKILEAWRRVE